MAMDVGAKGGVKSDINVTPLVDVMLVLLIIMFVVAPMLQTGTAVVLPETGNPERQEEGRGQIMVAISAVKSEAGRYVPGSLYVDQDVSTPARLTDKLKEAYDRSPGTPVVIKADARLSYGDVKKIVLEVRDAGFKGVGLVAKKKPQA